MDSLSDTTWDVVLSGTGLPQSILALALSRSGKNVLHIDKNEYYGGEEAALSLQEVEAWVKVVNQEHSIFSNAAITVQEGNSTNSKLGFSRAYSISLSPQLIYNRSNILPALVSSKIYRQLEFLGVGSWWLYDNTPDEDCGKPSIEPSGNTRGRLSKIPGGREEIFQDDSIDLRSARSLMKFLNLVTDEEALPAVINESGHKPFPDFLTSEFNIPIQLQAPLLALTASPNIPAMTSTAYAIPRVNRHLTSLGLFGPGFSAVIPKWGGLAEVAQVACRAGAVGGGVYMLKKGIESIELQDCQHSDPEQLINIHLAGQEKIKCRWLAGTSSEIPWRHQKSSGRHSQDVSRSIAVISSTLSTLFPAQSEATSPPAAAVVVFGSGSLGIPSDMSDQEIPPVYFVIHSSDTGECPVGQCIIYAQTSLSYPNGLTVLRLAMKKFVAAIAEDPKPNVLWNLSFTQKSLAPNDAIAPLTLNPEPETPILTAAPASPQIVQLLNLAPDIALEDSMLKNVHAAWKKIVGDDTGDGFLKFEDREGMGDVDGEEDDF